MNNVVNGRLMPDIFKLDMQARLLQQDFSEFEELLILLVKQLALYTIHFLCIAYQSWLEEIKFDRQQQLQAKMSKTKTTILVCTDALVTLGIKWDFMHVHVGLSRYSVMYKNHVYVCVCAQVA